MAILSKKNNISILKLLAVIFIGITFFLSKNDAQSQWKVQTRDSLYNFNGVYFVNVYTGWVSGSNGKIFKTTNGGYNWFQQLSNSPANNLQRIQFPQPSTGYNSTVGYMVGYVDNNSPQAAVLLETTDGGYIWQNVLTRNYFYWKDVFFFNNFTGFFVGARDSTSSTGYIMKTTTGGIGAGMVYEESSFNYGVFKSVSFVNVNTGYASATDSNKNSTILKTLNAGGDWFVASTLPNVDIRQMSFLKNQSQVGFAVGGGYNGTGAKILKTTNGGVNWTIQTFGMDGNYFNGISVYYDPVRLRYRIWVCGENGNVYNSTNVGVTWYKQQPPFQYSQNMNAISFVSLDVGWAAGNSGSVITTYTGGDSVSAVNVISNNVPDKFAMSQNYPNPFNPETKIRFSVPVSSDVKIVVYNSLGKIVNEIVDSRLQAGEYETNFNASGLPSGIYFYTIRSGTFFKSMKMLLVK
ncbi:hypothetical protein BH10BAC5_BH10BAC5_26670 [soil metagenome]